MALPDFSSEHLTEAERAVYRDWWTAYLDPKSHYQDPPSTIFDTGSVKDQNRNGSYSYARPGAYYLASIAEALRVTGDPKLVDELVKWSKTLGRHLRDHDGRGYEYFQYFNPTGENSDYWYTDTIFLDEQLLAANIAHLAWVLHENRSINGQAGEQADKWFAYLDRNWVPKWLARTTTRSAQPFVPDPSLGLKNTVGWSSPHNKSHDDSHPAYAPEKFGAGTVNHQLPVRDIVHSYVASLYQYTVMGRYFADRPSAMPSGIYSREAQARRTYWLDRTDLAARKVPHILETRELSPDSDSYAQFVTLYLNATHRVDASIIDADELRAWTRVWTGDGTNGVYRSDGSSMSKYLDGSGGDDKLILLLNAMLAPWDSTGLIESITAKVVKSPQEHLINGESARHHISHYSGILTTLAHTG